MVTRPDAPAGRGRRLAPSPGRRSAAEELGVPGPQARAPARPGVPGRAARAARRTAARWSRTAPCCRSRRSTSRAHGWVNLHFSVLPAWRGAAPVQHALWAGDEVTGATTFRIVKELDAGPTYGVMTERVRPDRHRRRPARPAGRGRRRAAGRHPRRHRGRLARGPRRSPTDGVSFAPKITVEDARVDWAEPAVGGRPPDPGLHARRPGAWTTYDGERVKLGPVTTPADGAARRPASSRSARTPSLVGTGTAAVRLGEVKAFGKKQMPAADWARGVRVAPGARLRRAEASAP